MDVDQVIGGRLSEARDFISRGATFSGFVRLGEIWKFLESRVESGEPLTAWQHAVLGDARRVDISHLRAEAADALGRLQRMVSTSGVYDIYEVVLMLTLRVELESCAVLLSAINAASDIVPLSIDDDIRELRRDNAQAYSKALAMLRRNWGFPIESIWLT